MKTELRKVSENKWQVIDLDEDFAFDEYFFVVKEAGNLFLESSDSSLGCSLLASEVISIGEAMLRLNAEVFGK